jgi:hypothetical protein
VAAPGEQNRGPGGVKSLRPFPFGELNQRGADPPKSIGAHDGEGEDRRRGRSRSNAVYHGGSWEVGTLKGSQLVVDGLKVVGARGAAIGAPTAGSTVDAEARTAIGQILSAMRQHGLIEM